MSANTNCNTSEVFCCKFCGADVALAIEPGGDLSYQCQNAHCGWACSVDCPQALGLKVEGALPSAAELEARDWDAELASCAAELEAYAAEWDAYAAALQALTEPQPEPPAPAANAAQQRARSKAEYLLSTGIRPVRARNGWLIPSNSRSTIVHYVDDAQGCSCEASQYGRPCWHSACAELLAQDELKRAA
jgi:hypothetical protein